MSKQNKSGLAKDASLPAKGQALVAIVNSVADWNYVREQLWYRIPVDSVPRRFPPQWLAFYQTKVFKGEAYSIRYYGRISHIERVRRETLFPNELPNLKSKREYFQCFLESLETLPQPIVSLRLKRIVFISTTYRKLLMAEEVNDLYDDSPLEDALWRELKKLSLRAERQYDIETGTRHYVLDFALFCAHGKINIETDGDTWHATTEQIPEDNERNNAMAVKGWKVLRYNGAQIRESMAEYCVPEIVEMVTKLGGMQAEEDAPRRYYNTEDGIVQQLTLFDRSSAYTTEPSPDD